MAIVFDSTSNNAVNPTTALTISQTCAANATLVVFVLGRATDDITGVTYAGVSMTKVQSNSSAIGRWQYAFVLANPASGTNNVIISGTSNDLIQGVAMSYTGCNTTTEPETSGVSSGSGTALTGTVTTGKANEVLVGWGIGQGITSAGAGTTSRYQDNVVANGTYGDAPATTAGSNSILFTEGTTGAWNVFVVALQPPGSIATSLPFKSLLGVGI